MAAAVVMALSASAQQTEYYPSYVQVIGHAEMEVAPDEFYLSVVINERDSKGKISVESQQRDMIAALKRVGVDVDKQLKMANLSSEFFKRRTTVASAKYQLKLSSASEVARVWQALDQLGISQVSIQQVSHSRIGEFKREVRDQAMRNARDNASSLAAAIDQKIGPCFYIYDSDRDVMPRFYNNAMVTRKAFDAEVAEEEFAEEAPEFKTIKLEYSVQAKFVLL